MHPLLHSKIRNVPFPRPRRATGNDARKLHALAFVHVRGALLMHAVLCAKIYPVLPLFQKNGVYF